MIFPAPHQVKITFNRPNFQPWKSSQQYTNQIENAKVLDLHPRTQEGYKSELQRAADVAISYGLKIETTMICGTGGDIIMPQLTLDVFSGIKKLHLIDWHRPYLDALHSKLLQSSISMHALDIFLHLADLQTLDVVPKQEIHLAICKKLFQHYQDDQVGYYCLLANIAAKLTPNGMLFSVDHTINRKSSFYQTAFSLGLMMVADRIFIKIA